jgi:hypothetical protein
MIDFYLKAFAEMVKMDVHTLKVCIVVGGVGAYVWECCKNWIAPRIIAWRTREEGPEPKLIAKN